MCNVNNINALMKIIKGYVMRINMEIEHNLIINLLKIEKEIHFLQTEDIYCMSNDDRIKNELEIIAKNNLLLELSKDLINISDVSTSEEIIRHLIDKFSQMEINVDNGKRKGYISRNQGTVTGNCFLGKILVEINSVINCNFQELPLPFLYCTNDLSDRFDADRLISFFKNEINILRKIELVNYFIIREYHKGFAVRLFKLTEKLDN